MAQYYEAVGRRKESTARVRLVGGSGAFTVNEKEAAVYFPRLGDLKDVLRAFVAVGQDASKYDVSVKVNGGGVTGQTEAVRLGLARALVLLNGEWTSALRKTWFAHPRCPRQGAQETRSEESPQGSNLHQTLIHHT